MDLDRFALDHLRPTGLFTHAEAQARGINRRELQRLLYAGSVVAVGSGHYVDVQRWDGVAANHRMALRSWALSTRFSVQPVLSHRAAAALHHLPLLPSAGDRDHDRRIHLTGNQPGRTISTGAYTIHSAYGTDQCSQSINGMSLVLPVLAAFGIAEIHGFTAGVVALDAALHTKIASVDEAWMWLSHLPRRPSSATIRRVIQHSDSRSESPLESQARLIINALGYTYAPQVVLRTSDGHFLGRVDGLIEALGVVVEVDGRIKYTGDHGRGSVEAVVSEKHRESAIRDLGYAFIRLDHAALQDPTQIDVRIRAAARRAHPDVCRRT